MGRYYSTENGEFNGKFWFGVQGSDEPGWVYGMAEEQGEPDEDGDECLTELWYYADEDNVERIMNVLDRQYTILGVNKYKRRYNFDNGNEIADYVWGELQDMFLQDKQKRGANTIESTPYLMGPNEKKYAINEQRVRAASRVDLGLRILNDIRKHGECHLMAEC